MFASEEIKMQRRAICKECPHITKSIGGYSCGTLMIPTKETCGCYIRTKTSLSLSKCPSKKW